MEPDVVEHQHDRGRRAAEFEPATAGLEPLLHGQHDVAGTLEVAGRVIDLGAIKSPAYVVSAINDHIVPWEASFKTTGLVSGPVRFVLSSGGHIAGIVNPPGPKAWYQVAEGEQAPTTAAAWRSGAERRGGSWWEDWARWSDEHSGPLQDPPAMGSTTHPVLGDGPGTYVRS